MNLVKNEIERSFLNLKIMNIKATQTITNSSFMNIEKRSTLEMIRCRSCLVCVFISDARRAGDVDILLKSSRSPC